MRWLLVPVVPFVLLGLWACSQTEPPKAHEIICDIGSDTNGVHRNFTCAEINAQADCPRCS